MGVSSRVPVRRAPVVSVCGTLAVLAGTALAGAALAGAGAAPTADAGEPHWKPPDDTITAVTGTRSSGFHVSYVGRPTAYLPSVSEALVECGEYHKLYRRVRCRVEVRTWYRDLGDTKRAIRYARLDTQ